jgi:hypothetical protein
MVDTLRPFTRELRKQGFGFRFRDRSGGTTVTEFSHHRGDRGLRVQLWGTGKHRVSHGTYHRINGIDCLHETTPPTDFETLPEMLAAIELEWRRPSTIVPAPPDRSEPSHPQAKP